MDTQLHISCAPRQAASLTGEFTVDVNLTSCETLDAAVTAALAADLDLDIFAISVSLAGCSDDRSLSVFRRLASWHVRFTVLVSRSLWSEVRTAASNIVEDIASFALTLSGALCDQGVNATVAQSMQVMAFFLSDTTTGGTTSDGTTTTSATAALDAVTPHSPTVTAICVSGVAELTVELRPADEGEPATMFVCSAEDSDITGSSVDDVVVCGCDLHCQVQGLQRRGQFDSERCL